MLKYLVFLGIVVGLGGMLALGARGCDGFFPQESVFAETEDSQYLRGKELRANGRDSEAMSVFQSIIRAHPEVSPESNLEAGLIAFDQGQYPLAIYHFNQFLALFPDASPERRAQAIGLINSSKKKFLGEMIPNFRADSSQEKLEKKYRELLKENDVLKREIARLRALAVSESGTRSSAGANPVPAESVPVAAAPVPAPRVETPPPPPPKPDVPATHTVAPGETLSSISKKYYGTIGRVNDIYNANRVTLSSPNALRPGMVLKLPRP